VGDLWRRGDSEEVMLGLMLLGVVEQVGWRRKGEGGVVVG
jgi:hypothetical protein